MASTKKPVTLEDYIDKYLADKEASKPKSYREFIMHGGRGGAIVGAEGSLSAKRTYDRSLSSYGMQAEKLAGKGLYNSGYADYINESAEKQKQKSLDIARGGALAIAAENDQRYKSYVERIADKMNDEKNKILKQLESATITDYNKIYGLATKLGLSNRDADAVAQLVSEASIKKLTDMAVVDVVKNRLTKNQAREYAKQLGLSDEDAEKIANYAEYINQNSNYNDTSSGYLDYLRDRLDK